MGLEWNSYDACVVSRGGYAALDADAQRTRLLGLYPNEHVDVVLRGDVH